MMPRVTVLFYRESDGSVPVLEWMDAQPSKAVDKCVVRFERLRQLGHELRRPEADYLRDEIYELRTRFQSVNYRVLYFFHDRTKAVLVHALTKEQVIPVREMTIAIERKLRFESEPDVHTARE